MLSLNILPICHARGIRYPFAYLTRNGFTHSSARKISAGIYAQPKLAYIETLCILLKCVPHDILEWTPAADQPQDIPLAVLIPHKEDDFKWMQDMQKLPLDQLRALGEVVKGELGK